MPIRPKVRGSAENERTVTLSYEGEEAQITYNWKLLTWADKLAISTAQDAKDYVAAARLTHKLLCRIITAWELVDEDGNQLPIAEETFLSDAFDEELITAIWQAINENDSPKETSAKPSPPTLQATESLAPSPTGTSPNELVSVGTSPPGSWNERPQFGSNGQ